MRRFALPILFLVLSCSPASGQPQGLDDLVAGSSLAFRGTVLRLGASTEPLVPAAQDTAVVRVEETLRGAGTQGELAGQEITVRLRNPSGWKPGQEAVFFASVEVYGKTVAVREVGHLPVSGDLQKGIAEAVQRLADRGLGERLARAELVVVGTVARVEALPRRGSLSEHDPQWGRAVLRVEAVLKGKPPQGELAILFARSRDVRWYRAPKLKEGQAGVFLLHPAEEDRQAGELALLDPLDAQPAEQRQRIERLLGSKN
jgi:hypothetical protein